MKTLVATQIKRIISASFLTAALFICYAVQVSAQVEVNNSSSNATPALLLGFSGEMSTGNSLLTWTMENETSSKCFIIERSASGSEGFDSIGMVFSLNNNHETTYTFSDGQMLSGNNYYRLRLVSLDGVVRYSKIISIDNVTGAANATPAFQLFPNPAASQVNYRISASKNEQVSIQIYNLSGILILSEEKELAAGLNQQSIAISTLKNGNYFLKVRSADGAQFAQAFVKFM